MDSSRGVFVKPSRGSDGRQWLLGRATWNADAVRDEVRRYAAEHLLAEGEGGALIVDQTGFFKKGSKSVGVQRQYSGTAGRIENCRVTVFLDLAELRRRALAAGLKPHWVLAD